MKSPNFKLIGIKPGPVVMPGPELIDFREDIPEEKLRELYDHGCPYLELVKMVVKKPVATRATRK